MPLYILTLFLSACVTAPNVDRARILPDAEVAAVTIVKKAKDLSSSGRYDLAEQELRIAVKMLPNQSSVFNDLGVVLMSQSRYLEAADVFLQATDLDPYNAVALENYAKVLYKDGDYFSSLKQFDKLLDLLFSSSEEQIQKSTGKIYTNQDFVNILRSKASAYYALGYYDQSLCLSNEAMLKSPDIYQVGIHSRLLLSFDRVDESHQILENTINFLNGVVPPGMMLDYAVTLFLKKDYDKSATYTDNALKNPQINSVEKRIGLLTSYMILVMQKKDKEAENLAENMINNDEQLCSINQLMKNSYLPASFEDLLKLVRGRICKSANK